MMPCRCCHEAVNDGQRDPLELCLASHGAPDFRNCAIDWQQTIRESGRQVALQPSFQLVALLSRRQKRHALANLSKGKDAQVECVLILSVHPPSYPCIRRPRPTVLGNYVGIEQIPAHSSMSRP